MLLDDGRHIRSTMTFVDDCKLEVQGRIALRFFGWDAIVAAGSVGSASRVSFAVVQFKCRLQGEMTKHCTN